MTFFPGDSVKNKGKRKIWTVDSTTEDDDGYEKVLITREDKAAWRNPEEITLYLAGEQRKLHDRINDLIRKHTELDRQRKEEADVVTAVSIDAGMIPIAWLRTVIMAAPTAYTVRDDSEDLSFSDPNGSGMMRDAVTKARLDLRLDRSRATKALLEALRK